MYSVHDDHKWPGFPIRKSTDQSLLTAPHGLSQRATSFIASQCQGIHQMPFRHLIVLITTMHHRLAFWRMMFAISLPLAARLAANIATSSRAGDKINYLNYQICLPIRGDSVMTADARKPPVPTRTGKSLLHIVKQHRTKQRERTKPADP
jgi:hypothetical protein